MKPVKLNKLTKGFSNKQVWINGPYLSNGTWILPSCLALYYPHEVEAREFPYKPLLEAYKALDNSKVKINPSDLILHRSGDYIRLWADHYNHIICGASDAFCQTVMDNLQPDSVYYFHKQRWLAFDCPLPIEEVPSPDGFVPVILMPYDLSSAKDYLKEIRWEM
jgi:hypothetical protein